VRGEALIVDIQRYQPKLVVGGGAGTRALARRIDVRPLAVNRPTGESAEHGESCAVAMNIES